MVGVVLPPSVKKTKYSQIRCPPPNFCIPTKVSILSLVTWSYLKMVFLGNVKKFSACGAHFHMSLQFMTMKVCLRKKTFSPTHKMFEVLLQFSGNDPPLPTDQTPMDNPGLRIRLLSHSKLMYQFVVSFKAYPEAKISLIAQFIPGILHI